MDALYLTEIVRTYWMQTLDEYWNEGDTLYSGYFDFWPEWLFQYYNELNFGEAIESVSIVWKSEQHSITPRYDILRSLVPLLKYYTVNMEEDSDKLTVTFKLCNNF